MQGRRKLGPDEEPGLVYSRFNNPNLEVLEDRLALWDEAEASLAFALRHGGDLDLPVGVSCGPATSCCRASRSTAARRR